METARMTASHTASAASFSGCSSCARMSSAAFGRAILVFLDAGILASIIICRALANLLADLGLLVGIKDEAKPGMLKRA
ncbi:MAG: hypothetical protein HDT19_03190 [Oscillibacter sp.]|nr:hypothetical protein [Oscillibacter sp.]